MHVLYFEILIPRWTVTFKQNLSLHSIDHILETSQNVRDVNFQSCNSSPILAVVAIKRLNGSYKKSYATEARLTYD
jgi:hypothetical protein